MATISSINSNKRGIVLILTLMTLLVILTLVMGLLLVTNLRHRKASQELSSSLSSEVAESAVDQQILFADARNWNIDWDDDGVINNTDVHVGSIPSDVGIPVVNQWQSNTTTLFPKIVWMKDATNVVSETAIYNPDYMNGTKSAIYNFNTNKNLFINHASGQNQPYRAILKWDNAGAGVNSGLDVSYMGITTGEGSVKISGRTNRCVLRKVVKVLPEAFNHHVVYAQTVNINGATLPANLSISVYANSGGFPANQTRLIKLDLPGAPSPYFNSPGFPRIFDPANSIKYYSGPTTITGPITINGTVVVNGSLTLDSTAGAITITTAYNTTTNYAVAEETIVEPRVYPAIVCTGNITLTGSSPITIAGLVYTDPRLPNDFTIAAVPNTPETTINGTIIARTVTLQSNTKLDWNQAVFDYPAPFFLNPAPAMLNNATNPNGNDLRLFGDEGKKWVYKR